jgi:dolichol-phosphate mannosyltransferase
MADSKLISVVVPCLNEQDNVHVFYKTVTEVTDRLSEYQWEFVFIDDGSKDQTIERILELRKADPRVRALQLSRNFGSYAALRAGLEYARGDAVITISVDLQDPPDLFPVFVKHWQGGYHTVWGVREQRDDPLGKRILANLFYRLIRRIALPDLPAGGMDCGLFDRQVVEVFRDIRDRNSITFLTIHWMGFHQIGVPYHRQSRKFGYSKWPLGRRLKAALDVITQFSYLPIRLCSYLGIALALLSFLVAGFIVFNKLVLNVGGWGWPSVITALLFLGGLQLLMLGVLGEYVWRLGSEIRARPWYIVMNQIGFDDLPLRTSIPLPMRRQQGVL